MYIARAKNSYKRPGGIYFVMPGKQVKQVKLGKVKLPSLGRVRTGMYLQRRKPAL